MTDPLPAPPATLVSFREVAADRLGAFAHTTVPDSPGSRRAGVVVCVVEHQGVPSVILIKRAYRGRNAGQWGLPGGRVDEGETPVEAALRELDEELGLRVGPAEVLGRLDDFPAASGFSITPVVVAPADPGPLRPSPAEVHSVHHVSLARLADEDTPRWVPQIGGGRLLQMRLRPDWVVHPPTGAMLWQFREVVLLGREARVAGFLQPDWTRS
ncbi:CoA pyrophosphatase [Actinomadura viridis]|uniref:8-oxo-dGTP pyrophosphatase MutT (NUDIX family) n=1 Tax=Actinomadura viridis TaxID=58110 RepID=A0A931GMZ9_9ACTN|nr:CoA pyrophosphatase [Actinomadura viridis]MBG6089001.1 8-oxo-dGTP pyrophosphatase MutT (NUDIX family) [Actinomadura viridis]